MNLAIHCSAKDTLLTYLERLKKRFDEVCFVPAQESHSLVLCTICIRLCSRCTQWLSSVHITTIEQLQRIMQYIVTHVRMQKVEVASHFHSWYGDVDYSAASCTNLYE